MVWRHNTAPCREGTQTSVASSASSVQILAANEDRNGFSLYNDSSAILYLLLASGTASSSANTLQVAAGAYFEAPYNYLGEVNGVWASADGSARVTEFS